MNRKKKAIVTTLLVCAFILSGAEGVCASGNYSAKVRADESGAYASASYENHLSDDVTVPTAEQAFMRSFEQTSIEQESEENTYPAAEVISDAARSMPAGAYRMNVNINGRDVLKNSVFGIGSTTYVPLFRFCDWLGVFQYKYDKKTGVASVSGDNLEISAKEGMLYIVANGRYFYTVDKIINFNGETYVPIRTITKALNSKVEWSGTEGKFKVYSGDTSLLKSASQVYREDEIYWLSRIINAEAGGESLQGKLAVGNVILNRVRSSALPNTIYSVIFDKKYGVQFTPTINGTIYKAPNAESIIAAKMCIEGYSLSSDILYFFNPKKSPSNWISNNRKFAFQVGNHAFYY